jgi:IrrE N-terminal-like domain
MKVLRDPLGRPIDRLFFEVEVLDERCERRIVEFMNRHRGGFQLPIPTSVLIQMIAAEASELELHADLAPGVDGYTDYFVDRKPKVCISERLSATRFLNRFRFTLGHEYTHVWFHAPLWRKSEGDPSRPAEPSWTCHRDTIGAAQEKDRMEWQADQLGTAMLMPRSELLEGAREIAMREASACG